MLTSIVIMEKSILIESKIENINKIEKIIDEVSEEANINSEVYGKILIATIEAVNNSIVHGNSQDNSKNVKVDFKVTENYISIFIEDEGTGFNFYNVPDPTTPENIENIQSNFSDIEGRTIYFIVIASACSELSPNSSK